MSTISELFAKRVEGEEFRIRQTDDAENVWFQPFFMTTSGVWYGLDENYEALSYSDKQSNWTLWTPPKKSVKRWLWDVRHGKDFGWKLCDEWHSEDEAKAYFENCEYRKSAVCIDGREDEE